MSQLARLRAFAALLLAVSFASAAGSAAAQSGPAATPTAEAGPSATAIADSGLAATPTAAAGPAATAIADSGPTAVATAVVPTQPLPIGVQAVGSPSAASISPSGGQIASADGALTVHAFADPARPPLSFAIQAVDARTLPAPQSGLSLGFAAFQLSAPVTTFQVPLELVIKPGASDLALALGRLERLYVGSWNGSSWVAVPCSTDVATGSLLVCSTTQTGLFVPLIVLPVNPALDRLDNALPGGHFYTQGNGFGGGGGLGYTVIDDDNAPMWSELQRQGGISRLGYPVTNRFLYGGALTQAFQNGALQWQPDLGQSSVLNVLDELHAHGSDSWLDVARQIPPPPSDGQPADVSILAPFPGMLAVYQADPGLYGLPVSVKDYGQLGSARFQRSTMQVWQQDRPPATAGTVVPGAAGDLAKAAGLWPLDAATPAAPPAT
jgi:hypothetical protein